MQTENQSSLWAEVEKSSHIQTLPWHVEKIIFTREERERRMVKIYTGSRCSSRAKSSRVVLCHCKAGIINLAMVCSLPSRKNQEHRGTNVIFWWKPHFFCVLSVCYKENVPPELSKGTCSTLRGRFADICWPLTQVPKATKGKVKTWLHLSSRVCTLANSTEIRFCP